MAEPRRKLFSSSSTIIIAVRQMIAAVLLTAMASPSALDGVCCPDGCTQERQSSTQPQHPSTDGGCVLCIGIDASANQELTPDAVVTRRFVIPIRLATDAEISDPFDHPPRI